MPSTFLLLGLLLIYVMVTGRLTEILVYFRLLSESTIFKPEKLAEKIGDEDDDDYPEGKQVLPGELPPDGRNVG